jgi:hypothetical protein
MNANTDFDQLARTWLQDGPTTMPDRSLQAALDEVHVTSQQRFGAARRVIPMNGNISRWVVAAVIGLLVIAAGGIYIGNNSDTGGVGGQPAPTPSPVPTPTPAAVVPGALAPGRYSVGDGFILPYLSLTFPAGWQTYPGQTAAFSKEGVSGIEFHIPANVNDDPCLVGTSTAAPTTGPTVDDFIADLRQMQSFTTGPVEELVVGGLPAKAITLQNAIDTSTAGCVGGAMLPIFDDVATNGGLSQRLILVQVGDTRLLIVTEPGVDVDPAVQSELDAIVDSITFD